MGLQAYDGKVIKAALGRWVVAPARSFVLISEGECYTYQNIPHSCIVNKTKLLICSVLSWLVQPNLAV